MLVVEHDTTGPNQMDPMDELPDGSTRQRFIAIYLDFLYHLAKVRVAGSSPVVRSTVVRSTVVRSTVVRSTVVPEPICRASTETSHFLVTGQGISPSPTALQLGGELQRGKQSFDMAAIKPLGRDCFVLVG